jgi:hypothetical protein
MGAYTGTVRYGSAVDGSHSMRRVPSRAIWYIRMYPNHPIYIESRWTASPGALLRLNVLGARQRQMHRTGGSGAMHERILHRDATPGRAAAASDQVNLPEAIERLKSQLADASPDDLSDAALLDLQAMLDTLAKLIGDEGRCRFS